MPILIRNLHVRFSAAQRGAAPRVFAKPIGGGGLRIARAAEEHISRVSAPATTTIRRSAKGWISKMFGLADTAPAEKAEEQEGDGYVIPPPLPVGEIFEMDIREIYSRQCYVNANRMHDGDIRIGGQGHAPGHYSEEIHPEHGQPSIPEVYWVDWQGDEPFWALMEGNHRTADAWKRGIKTVKVRVVSNPPKTAKVALNASNNYIPFGRSPVWEDDFGEETYLGTIEGLFPLAKKLIQRHASGPGGGQTPEWFDGLLRQSSGQPLPQALRSDMEEWLGGDYSNVRIHTDAAAQQAAEVVNAHAFTLGTNIYFGAGADLTSPEGIALVGHELTHVDQNQGGVRRSFFFGSRGGNKGKKKGSDRRNNPNYDANAATPQTPQLMWDSERTDSLGRQIKIEFYDFGPVAKAGYGDRGTAKVVTYGNEHVEVAPIAPGMGRAVYAFVADYAKSKGLPFWSAKPDSLSPGSTSRWEKLVSEGKARWTTSGAAAGRFVHLKRRSPQGVGALAMAEAMTARSGIHRKAYEVAGHDGLEEEAIANERAIYTMLTQGNDSPRLLAAGAASAHGNRIYRSENAEQQHPSQTALRPLDRDLLTQLDDSLEGNRQFWQDWGFEGYQRGGILGTGQAVLGAIFSGINSPRQSWAFIRGAGNGAVNAVEGMVDMVLHPIETAEGIVMAVIHFDDTIASAKQAVDELCQAAQNDPEKFAEMLGGAYGNFAVGMVPVSRAVTLAKNARRTYQVRNTVRQVAEPTPARPDLRRGGRDMRTRQQMAQRWIDERKLTHVDATTYDIYANLRAEAARRGQHMSPSVARDHARRISAEIAEGQGNIYQVTADLDLIFDSGRVWGRTEGSVYAMAVDDAPRWRTGANNKTQTPGKIVFVGEAAELFKPHRIEGLYSGMKRAVGQHKAEFGDIVFDKASAEMVGDLLVIRKAHVEKATFAGQSTAWARAKLWGRRLGIEPMAVAAAASLPYLPQALEHWGRVFGLWKHKQRGIPGLGQHELWADRVIRGGLETRESSERASWLRELARMSDTASTTADQDDEAIWREMQEPGERLEEGIRTRLESFLGKDLGEVRVHKGAVAERVARSVNAEAFTMGQHVYLGAGADLDSPEGMALLAHEVTHVVQDQEGRTATDGLNERQVEVLEEEAHRHERAFLAQAQARTEAPPPPLVYRTDPAPIPGPKLKPTPAKQLGPRQQVHTADPVMRAMHEVGLLQKPFSGDGEGLSQSQFLDLLKERVMELMRDELDYDNERRETLAWNNHLPMS